MSSKQAGKNQKVAGPTRAATYARCSTDEQASGDYTTVDAQRQITSRFGVERGRVIVADLADEGKSGTSMKRPGLSALLSLAASGAIDEVIVTYMSRLGRGKAFTIAEYELKKHGVKVVCAEEVFSEGVAGYTQQAVKQFLDGMYPEQVKEWTLTKMRQMFLEGYHVGGQPRLGYALVPAGEGLPNRNGKTPKRKAVEPDGAGVVAGAFVAALTTREVRAGADYLTAATGRVWTYQAAYRLLTCRDYIGEAHWGGMVKEGAHPAIVERDVFDAVQEFIAAAEQGRARVVTRPDKDSQHASAYYLRGRIFCAVCGYAMTPKRATGKNRYIVHYYECDRAAKNGRPCSVGRVSAARLHSVLFSEIGEMAAHPWRIRRHIEAAMERYPRPEKVDAALTAARKRLDATEKQINNLVAAVAESGASVIAALSRRIAALEESRATLKAEVERLSMEAARIRAWRPNSKTFEVTLSLFSQVWERVDDAERCRLTPLLIDRVDVQSRAVVEAILLPGILDGTNLRSLRDDFRKPMAQRDGPATVCETTSSDSPLIYASSARLPIRLTLTGRKAKTAEEVPAGV